MGILILDPHALDPCPSQILCLTFDQNHDPWKYRVYTANIRRMMPKFKTNIIGETVMHEFCVTSKSEPLAPRAPTWFDETHKLKVQTSNSAIFFAKYVYMLHVWCQSEVGFSWSKTRLELFSISLQYRVITENTVLLCSGRVNN